MPAAQESPPAIDPRIRRFIDHATRAMSAIDVDRLTITERRAAADAIAERAFRTVAEEGPPVADVTDHEVPVDGATLRLRLYRPDGHGPHPVHVLIHGGGWWQGSIDNWICGVQARERCVGANVAVAMVEYRLAPEHRFPTAPNDCYGAVCWIADHAARLRLDAGSVSVGGPSAGGNLAAAVALMLRDRGGPRLRLQLLEVPAADHRLDHPSVLLHGSDYDLTIPVLEEVRGHYFADPGDWTHPYAAPLLAPDVAGLPRAHVMTAELDPLRDGAEQYAARLRSAGVTVTGTRHLGMTHTAPAMTSVLLAARAWRAEIVGVLAGAHHGAGA